MNWMVLAALFVCAALLSAGAVAAFIPLLRRRRIVDRPNDRSSHRVPTPRGAGLAVVPLVALSWIALDLGWIGSAGSVLVYAACGALVLCAVSWLDDLRGLGPLARLSAHVAIVAAILSAVPSNVSYSQGLLPFWADRLLIGLIWVWFINLYNFMDGIDGISAVEAIAVTVGVVAICAGDAFLNPLAWPAAIVMGAAAGFLAFNWHPARIFLGDSGSIPFGFLLGWLLLQLAAAGYWAPALILPLYYFADATITLARRVRRGEKIWQAHRQHYYQRAVAGGSSHARVSLMIAAANVLLIVFAIGSLYEPWVALFGAVLVTIQLLRLLARGAPAP